jgi:hypothetical protein
VCDGYGEILQAGAEAADWLINDVFRVPIEKALNPLDPIQFVTMVRRIARSLRAVAAPIEQEVADEVAKVVDANWPDMTAAQRKSKLDEIENLLAGAGIGGAGERELPGIQAVFEVSAEQLIKPTRRQLVKRYDLAIETDLTKRDLVTAEHLRETSALFVRNNYGDIAIRLSAKARDIVAAGLEKGLGRDDISGELSVAMKAAKRSDAYWNFTATTFSNRARNFTQVHAFDDAGIRAYSPLAVLDEVTTEQCRFLNGKEFPVDKSVKKIRQVQGSDDPESIVDQMPWISKGKNDDGQDILYYKKGDRVHTVAVIDESGEGVKDKIGVYSEAMASEAMMKAGIGMPPYHGSCRTTVIPVF